MTKTSPGQLRRILSINGEGMGYAMARDRIPTPRKNFFAGPAQPFEPFHRLKTEMESAR